MMTIEQKRAAVTRAKEILRNTQTPMMTMAEALALAKAETK